MIEISVIVPVYNGSIHLEKCISSILKQTQKNIELIVVDDGSSDDSLLIIRQFLKKDQRIKLISQENKGVSAARNRGLEIARGRWISFVDADDWMELNMLATLYEVAISNDSGLTVCNVNEFQKDKPFKLRLNISSGPIDYSAVPEKAVEMMMDFKYDYANWNKLYNGDIIRKYQIRFDEHISIGEDLLFNLYYLHFIDKIVCIDIPLYNYRIHEQSTMSKSLDKRVQQYDLQFKAYKCFAEKKRLVNEWNVFRRIMARGFYNILLPMEINNIKKQNKGKINSIKLLTKTLRNVSHELFYFPNKGFGLQAEKKRLLENGKFIQFSSLIALKHF